MARCYLGLGSNLKSPRRQLSQAIAALGKLPRSSIVKISSVYTSKPLGVRFQPMYVNMVIALQTTLSPQILLQHCQRIEHHQKRVKKKHWGIRTIDIDILLYGNLTLNTITLTIPHPQMHNRDFVLVPLLEIAPTLCLPNHKRLSSYLKKCTPYIVKH